VKAAPNPTSKIAFLREIAFDLVLSFIAQTPMCSPSVSDGKTSGMNGS
jgi:hypothetical protein